MREGQSPATSIGHNGSIDFLRERGAPPMIRLLPALAAVAASSSLAYGIAPKPSEPARETHRAEAPAVIGNDRPIFLGRMTVTATALPSN